MRMKKKSCLDKISEIYKWKCDKYSKGVEDCSTSITVSNIKECVNEGFFDSFPDKESVETSLRKIKGLDRSAHINVNTDKSNIPYLVISTNSYN
jgi:hypothetical protein